MVLVGQGEQRTLTVEQIGELYGQGLVTDASFVWREGMAEWVPLSSQPELKALMPSLEPSMAKEIDDSLPTTMLQSPMGAVPPPAPRPAAGQPQPGAGSGPVSSMGPEMSAARRPAPPRPDLIQAAVAADKGLAQQAPATVPPPAAPRMQNQGGQLVFPGGPKESSMLALPTQFFLAQLDSPRRKKRLFIGAGVGVAAVIGATALAFRSFDSKEHAAVEASWARLSACVIGAPLTDRETIGQRIRNVQLTVLGTPVERRAKAGSQPWPSRCAAEAHTLAEHAKASGGAHAPLQASAEALAKALLADPSATVGFTEQAEKLWADAATAKLKAGEVKESKDLALAPKPAAALGDESFRALPKFLSGTFSASNVRPAAPGGAAHFIIDQQDFADGPHVCSVGATGNATCKKAPAAAAKLSPGLRLTGGVEDGARPYLFAGDHGQLGALRPETGEAAASPYVLGAYSRKDGSLWAITRAGQREAKLLYVPATGAAAERSGPRELGGDAAASVGLAWGWVFYRTGPKGSPASHLLFRKLADKNEDPAASIDAGEIEEAPPVAAAEPPRKGPAAAGRKAPAAEAAPDSDEERATAACKADDTIAVRLRGQKNDAVSLLQAGRWSPPLKSASQGGTFTCRKGEATSVKVTPVMEQEKNWATLSHVRCNLSGCTPTTLSMKDLIPGLVEVAPVDAKSALAVDLDGKLLVVWKAGYLGGIRMRIAPPGQLKDADDIVIVDDRDLKNTMKLTLVTELKLVPAGNTAILFLGGPAGTRALRIDSSGAFSPVQASVQ